MPEHDDATLRVYQKLLSDLLRTTTATCYADFLEEAKLACVRRLPNRQHELNRAIDAMRDHIVRRLFPKPVAHVPAPPLVVDPTDPPLPPGEQAARLAALHEQIAAMPDRTMPGAHITRRPHDPRRGIIIDGPVPRDEVDYDRY